MTISSDVLAAIARERQYQDDKWGPDKVQSLMGWIAIMRGEINEAEQGWLKNAQGRHSPLAEILQVVTVGIRALEAYGVCGTTQATGDIARPW